MAPTKTPFAGFERLAPGDPLSSDGYYFQNINPLLADRLGRLGAVTHKHDAHAALADPALAMILSSTSSGGSIAAATAIFLTYTLLDSDGGETLPVLAQSITTPAGYLDPTDAPTVAVSYAAGTLQAGSYSYAATVSDGLGGETALGPVTVATVDPGHANAEVTVGNLATIVAASSGSDPAASWRLWRSQGGGLWRLIGTGTAATFIDNGVAGDCSVAPPATSTTKGANKLSVTVPGGQPAGTVSYNLYASLDGSFTSPALLGTLAIATAGTPQLFTNLAPLLGSPPPVSTCYPGASKIDPDTDILGNPWKRAVANAAALPALGNTNGDMRETLDDHTIHVWTGSAWAASGGGGAVDPVSSALGVFRVQGPTAHAFGASATTNIAITVPPWVEEFNLRMIVGLTIDHPDPSHLAATITSSQGSSARLFVAGSFSASPARIGYPPLPADPDNLVYFTDAPGNWDDQGWQPTLPLTAGTNEPAIGGERFRPVDLFSATLINDGDAVGAWNLAIIESAGSPGTLSNVVLYFISKEFESLLPAPKAQQSGFATGLADGGLVNHGLASAPTSVRATGSVAGEIVSVTAISASQFTVAIKTGAGAPGTSQTVYWDASG